MLFRKKDPASADVAVARRRRFAKPAAAALVLRVVVAGSLVAFRVSSAKKDEPAKARRPGRCEFTPADIAVVELRELARTLPISGSLSPVVAVDGALEGPRRGPPRARARGRDASRRASSSPRSTPPTCRPGSTPRSPSLEEARARLSIAAKNRDNGDEAAQAGLHLAERLRHHAERLRGRRGQREVRRGAGPPGPQRHAGRGRARAHRRASSRRRWSTPARRSASTARSSRSSTSRGWRSRRPRPPPRSPASASGEAATFRVDGFGERELRRAPRAHQPDDRAGSRAITVYLSVANRDGAAARRHVRQGQPRPRQGRAGARHSRDGRARGGRPGLRLHGRAGQDRAARGDSSACARSSPGSSRCAAASRRASRS